MTTYSIRNLNALLAPAQFDRPFDLLATDRNGDLWRTIEMFALRDSAERVLQEWDDGKEADLTRGFWVKLTPDEAEAHRRLSTALALRGDMPAKIVIDSRFCPIEPGDHVFRIRYDVLSSFRSKKVSFHGDEMVPANTAYNAVAKLAGSIEACINVLDVSHVRVG